MTIVKAPRFVDIEIIMRILNRAGWVDYCGEEYWDFHDKLQDALQQAGVGQPEDYVEE